MDMLSIGVFVCQQIGIYRASIGYINGKRTRAAVDSLHASNAESKMEFDCPSLMGLVACLYLMRINLLRP